MKFLESIVNWHTNDLKNMKNKIWLGDATAFMKDIPNSSINLVVTSPPYHVRKSYEKFTSYMEHFEMMEKIFIEVNRVLVPGGYAIFNFGDYFNSCNRFYNADVPSCYPATINYFHWGVEVAGMDLQATRIWRKQFAKMGIPFVCNTHPRPVFDYEHVWTFRKKNGDKEEFVNDRKLSQRGVIGEDWHSVAGLAKHCAAFPIELPTWAISVYSKSTDDVVLDMFAGSGTTLLAAKKLGRHYIGIEKKKEYYDFIVKRLSEND